MKIPRLILNDLGFMGFDLTIRKRIRYLQEIKDRFVLDVGCGYHGYIPFYLNRNGNMVMGIDTDESAIAENWGRKDTGMSFEVMSAYDIDKLELKFDVVVCMEVIEHIFQDDLVLKKICGVLKPNGILILSTIDKNCYLVKASKAEPSKREGDHVRLGYTAGELVGKLHKAGFHTVVTSTCVGKLTQRLLLVEYKLRSFKPLEYNQLYRLAIFILLYPWTLLDRSKDNIDDMTIVVEAQKGDS